MRWICTCMLGLGLMIGSVLGQSPESAYWPNTGSDLVPRSLNESSNPAEYPPAITPEVVCSTEVLTERFWFTRGAMIGFSKGQGLPPYVRVPVATGPTVATDQSHTDSLLFQGGVGEAGMWLNNDHRLGVEIGGIFLFQAERRRGPDPFYDTNNLLAGLFTSEARTRFFTLESNLRRRVHDEADLRVDFLLGYRFGYLSEDSTIAVEIPITGFGLARYNDRADSRNRFHGGQVGMSLRYKFNEWTLDVTSKLALGSVIMNGDLIGSSRALLEYGAQQPTTSQLLSQLTRRESRFAIMPTLNLRLSRQITEHGRMFIGYDLVYLSHASRPEGVLLGVNAPRLPGFDRSLSDFWIQGGSAGMEWRY